MFNNFKSIRDIICYTNSKLLYLLFIFLYMEISLAGELVTLNSDREPIAITADRLYIEEELKVLEGNVYGVWSRYRLSTERVEIRDGKLIFPTLTVITDTYTGSTFRFQSGYLQDDILTVETLDGEVQGVQPLRDKLYLRAERAKFYRGGKLEVERLRATTCSLQESHWHYHILARIGKIVLDDRAEFWNVKTFLGKTPILSRRYVRFSLKRRKRGTQTNLLPEIGYNKVEGWYLIKRFDYWVSQGNYGYINTKWAERTGTTAGVDHNFSFSKGRHRGYISYSRLDNKTTGSRSERLSGTLNTKISDKLSLHISRTESSFSTPRYQAPKTSSQLITLNYRDRGIGLAYTLRKSYTEGIYSSTTEKLDASYSSSKLSINYTTTESTSEYLSINRERVTRKTNLKLNYNSDKFTAQFLWDLSNGLTSYIDKTPELEITWKEPPKLIGRPVNITVAYGRYVQHGGTELTAKRYSIKTRYNSPELKLFNSDNFYLRFDTWFLQDFFDTGTYFPDRNWHARYALSFNTRLKYDISHLSFGLDLSTLSQKGFNPTIFESYVSKAYLRPKLEITYPRWCLMIRTNYDLLRPKIRPRYYITLDLKPSRRAIYKFTTVYESRYKRFSYITLNADLITFSDKLRVQVWTTYNLLTKQLSYLDVALVRDFHCYYAALVYHHTSQTLIFNMGLKALPGSSFSLGLNQYGPYFPGMPFMGTGTYGTSIQF